MITAFTTRSAFMNMPHGDMSCGSSERPMVGWPAGTSDGAGVAALGGVDGASVVGAGAAGATDGVVGLAGAAAGAAASGGVGAAAVCANAGAINGSAIKAIAAIAANARRRAGADFAMGPCSFTLE